MLFCHAGQMMNDKKPTSIPYHRKHLASEHNIVPRLEGVVKNAGIKPVRKPKAKIQAVTKV